MAFLNKAQAQRQAERLAYHIRKYGVRVVIDLRTGAGGNHWGIDTFRGAMAHHIVSRRSQGLTPFYSLVRNGRGGSLPVPGPLCNVYGGWDRIARIVTMGLANHPGQGGPWVVSGFRIPQDNGRYYFLGTEFEGGLNASDWDDDYRRFMAGVNAGKLDYIQELRGSSVVVRDTALCEHSDWARPKGRKIDRLGYTQARGVAEVQAIRRSVGQAPSPTPPSAPPPDMNDLNEWIKTVFKNIAEFQLFIDRRLDESERRNRNVQNEQLNLAWLRDMARVSEQTNATMSKVINAVGDNLAGAISALENDESFDLDKYIEGTRTAVQEALAESVQVVGDLRLEPRTGGDEPLPAQPTS